MIGDNPAARLLAVLEEGIKVEQTIKCRDVWHTILKTEKSEEALLFSRIGKVMTLPDQTLQIVKANFPNQARTCTHWITAVGRAFSEQNLNGQWQTFRQHIDRHTIDYLGLTADLIQTKNPTELLTNETIVEFNEKIQALLDEVLESDLTDEIKFQVSKYLSRIITSINEYRITGASPILDSIEGAFGHAFFDKEYHEAVAKTEIGSKIVSVLAALANTVTVAIGMPQLPQAVEFLIEKLK
ncbi:MAG: hypothetical protein NDI93_01075 [Pseudomonas sp.]|nr:hypothetical protein [Pseudomonas sp.]